MGEVNLGTLYDLNKQLMDNEKGLKDFEIKDGIRKICDFFNKKGNCDFYYYMLLCRERYDFTLFSNSKCGAILRESSFPKELYECLTNRGTVLSIEEVPGGAFEIWIRLLEDGEEMNNYVYYFFPYDNGVITIEEK